MITAEVRSFTELGIERFRAWLDQAESAEPKRLSSQPPPVDILFDDRDARPVGYGGPVAQRPFVKKYDLGMEVCRALGGEAVARLMPDANAWAWLSLFFHQSTFPVKKGRWSTGASSRHLVQTIRGRKQDQSHRHLVKGAVTNVWQFRGDAVVLMNEASGQSKIEEQVMSRRDDPPLAFHREFVKELYRLYWDIDADEIKRGAGGVGPGSIMHVMDLLTQFDLTYDISSLEAEDFLGLLPKAAFRRFLPREDGRFARRGTGAEESDGVGLPA